MSRGMRSAAVPGALGAELRIGNPAAQAVAQALRAAARADGMDGIRQHKEMARGRKVDGQREDFGVQPFHAVNGARRDMDSTGHPKEDQKFGEQSRVLADHERGIGKHVGRGKGQMPAQRHPDHGPHMHDGFGVGPIPR